MTAAAQPAPAFTLDTPVSKIPGIGPARAAALGELGVRSVAQLIAYLPTRHDRVEPLTPIAQLKPDTIVSARGLVSATRIVRQRTPRFEAVLVDDSGRLDLVWFNGLYMADRVQPGMALWVQGKARQRGPGLQLANPQFRIVTDEGDDEHTQTADASKSAAEPRATLVPVYPATAAISTRQIRDAVARVLEPALAALSDHFDLRYRSERELFELARAYRGMHAPRDSDEVMGARRRLAYDELLQLMLAMSLNRAKRLADHGAIPLKWSAKIDGAIRSRLPFALTAAQDRAVNDIAADLQRAVPANRLIQGDVGSGKTVVALYAMLMAAANKRQAALMAPTELLAQQHHAGIVNLLQGSKVRISLLTGSTPLKEKTSLRAAISAGEIDLVIGTHALLTDAVEFKSLAVAVIDEQHRFGVSQRAGLMSKARGASAPTPHTISMTATPIPRTLAVSLLGDLDVSTIDELPPGRRKISTRHVLPGKREEVYTFVNKRLLAGEQAFIVVPAIQSEAGADEETFLSDPGEGGAYTPRSVAEVAAELSAGPLKGRRIAQMHSRLPAAERLGIMDDFRDGRYDALVSTTVIEVGVDVPNATMMVIEDADRFGLATLHQLRGRVGRGTKASVCVLIGNPQSDEGIQRIAALVKTTDGFKLAETDLHIRGFGEIVGVKQSGMPPFRVVNFAEHMDLLTLARRDAKSIIVSDPSLEHAAHALLRRRLLKTHGRWLGLADVG